MKEEAMTHNHQEKSPDKKPTHDFLSGLAPMTKLIGLIKSLAGLYTNGFQNQCKRAKSGKCRLKHV